MADFRKFNWRWTFPADIVVLLVFTLGLDVGWFLALVLTEALMWMVRLIWISQPMLRFILRRLLHMIPILLAVIAIGFGLIQLAPGDVFSQIALNPGIEAADLEAFRSQFGLDRPWYEQFLRYVWNALRGNFGFSETYQAPVFALVSQRAGWTVLLSLSALILAWVFSIPAGMFAATNQYNWKDSSISVLAFIGLAIPNFFLAFLLLILVSQLSLPLPIGGATSLNHNQMSIVGQVLDVAHHMIIPVIVLGTSAMASLTRIMRANMLEILNQQYIVTARAKGQEERKVIYVHALRNAINPMITILGFQLGNVMAGAALVENVVSWPGLGRLILEAVLRQDLFLVVGSLIYGVILLVLGNLIADILLATVDPRVRIG
jgi:peptide/nickel transport system permease protein